MVFQQLGHREVIGRLDGGQISSDAGGMLLGEVEKHFGMLKRFSGWFRDYRDPQRIEHSVETLIGERVYGIALGYEDLNDHDEDPGSEVRQELERIVQKLREVWPEVRIIVRGDSGFCRDEIMSYCEHNEKMDYVLGLAKNSRFIQQIELEMAEAQQIQQATEKPARVFKDGNG